MSREDEEILEESVSDYLQGLANDAMNDLIESGEVDPDDVVVVTYGKFEDV